MNEKKKLFIEVEFRQGTFRNKSLLELLKLEVEFVKILKDQEFEFSEYTRAELIRGYEITTNVQNYCPIEKLRIVKLINSAVSKNDLCKKKCIIIQHSYSRSRNK